MNAVTATDGKVSIVIKGNFQQNIPFHLEQVLVSYQWRKDHVMPTSFATITIGPRTNADLSPTVVVKATTITSFHRRNVLVPVVTPKSTVYTNPVIAMNQWISDHATTLSLVGISMPREEIASPSTTEAVKETGTISVAMTTALPSALVVYTLQWIFKAHTIQFKYIFQFLRLVEFSSAI